MCFVRRAFLSCALRPLPETWNGKALRFDPLGPIYPPVTRDGV